MFYQQSNFEAIQEASSQHKEACKLAIGDNQVDYENKIDLLKKKWSLFGDSVPTRLMSPLFYAFIPTIYHAVMADNLKYFREHYNGKNMNSNELLGVACLCGSKKIAEFLLQELKLNYLSPGHDYMLGYIAASNLKHPLVLI